MLDYIIGLFVGIGICTYATYESPTKTQIGYTYQQLKQMKAECEKDLPRSTECSITVYYLPQAEQLEEVE